MHVLFLLSKTFRQAIGTYEQVENWSQARLEEKEIVTQVQIAGYFLSFV